MKSIFPVPAYDVGLLCGVIAATAYEVASTWHAFAFAVVVIGVGQTIARWVQ